jgi:hypothetical protein
VTTVRDVGFGEPTLPRTNGELLFDAPWQARAHALAVLAVEAAGCSWDDFRDELIAAIAGAEERPYWDSWVEALERFVTVRVQGAAGR